MISRRPLSIAGANGQPAVNAATVLTTFEGANIVRTATIDEPFLGPSPFAVDPRLGTFGDNGGLTWTFPLLPGSPAIDLGNDENPASSAPVTADQRDLTRPVDLLGVANGAGRGADVGAFEVQCGVALTSGAPPNGTLGSGYAHSFTVTGGTPGTPSRPPDCRPVSPCRRPGRSRGRLRRVARSLWW